MARRRIRITTPNQYPTVVYRGQTYRLLWVGSTRFGHRAKLGFHQGPGQFWVSSILVTYEDGRNIAPAALAAAEDNGTAPTPRALQRAEPHEARAESLPYQYSPNDNPHIHPQDGALDPVTDARAETEWEDSLVAGRSYDYPGSDGHDSGPEYPEDYRPDDSLCSTDYPAFGQPGHVDPASDQQPPDTCPDVTTNNPNEAPF